MLFRLFSFLFLSCLLPKYTTEFIVRSFILFYFFFFLGMYGILFLGFLLQFLNHTTP